MFIPLLVCHTINFEEKEKRERKEASKLTVAVHIAHVLVLFSPVCIYLYSHSCVLCCLSCSKQHAVSYSQIYHYDHLYSATDGEPLYLLRPYKVLGFSVHIS